MEAPEGRHFWVEGQYKAGGRLTGPHGGGAGDPGKQH